jgi:hypothetical protein
MTRRSCWLEISNGYASIDESSPSGPTSPLPPFPQWITQISHRLTKQPHSLSERLPLLTLKDCMIGLFTVQMLLEQQKGNLALLVLSTLEKIFPNSQIIRSQVGRQASVCLSLSRPLSLSLS